MHIFPFVDAILHGFDITLDVLRQAFLVAAVVIAGLCGVEWGVRTRRLNAFSAIARWSRRIMSPIVKPMERTVVRAGGVPSTAPLWTLIAIVVGGIVVLALLGFVRDQLANADLAYRQGGRGIARLALDWVFAIVYIAIWVRVIAAWFRLNPYGRWVRWAFVITDPILRPLRAILPPFGMIDVSPLVAYLLLSWVIQPIVMRLV